MIEYIFQSHLSSDFVHIHQMSVAYSNASEAGIRDFRRCWCSEMPFPSKLYHKQDMSFHINNCFSQMNHHVVALIVCAPTKMKVVNSVSPIQMGRTLGCTTHVMISEWHENSRDRVYWWKYNKSTNPYMKIKLFTHLQEGLFYVKVLPTSYYLLNTFTLYTFNHCQNAL